MRTSLVLATFLAACGGSAVSTVSTPGTAQVSGTLGGTMLTPVSAYASYDATSSTATIGLFDTANGCSSTVATGTRALELTVQDSTGGGTIAVTGDYTIGEPDPRVALATYVAADGTAVLATSGVVDITKNEAKGLRGAFDATFPDGSIVSGSFDASECAELVPPSHPTP